MWEWTTEKYEQPRGENSSVQKNIPEYQPSTNDKIMPANVRDNLRDLWFKINTLRAWRWMPSAISIKQPEWFSASLDWKKIDQVGLTSDDVTWTEILSISDTKISLKVSLKDGSTRQIDFIKENLSELKEIPQDVKDTLVKNFPWLFDWFEWMKMVLKDIKIPLLWVKSLKLVSATTTSPLDFNGGSVIIEQIDANWKSQIVFNRWPHQNLRQWQWYDYEIYETQNWIRWKNSFKWSVTSDNANLPRTKKLWN